MAEMRSPLHVASSLFQSGKAEQAGVVLEKLLGDQPENFEALTLLGVIRATSGHPDAAIPLFEKVARVRPGDASIHINLAKACEEQGRFDDAIGYYRRALEIEPNNDAFHINLGNLLKENNDLMGATAHYERALEINPGNAWVHSNLGTVLVKQGLLDDAVGSHKRALEIDSGNALLHSNMGIALNAQGFLDDAVVSHKRALEIDPGIASIHNNLGYALEAQDRLEEAVANYHKALAIKPDYAVAYSNLGNALTGLGQLEEALANYHKALAIKSDCIDAGKSILVTLLYVPGITPKELFAEHVRFAENQVPGITRLEENLTNDPDPERRLRIGYLSSDFREHPVGLNVFPLIFFCDQTKFEVFCYADVQTPDSMTERFQAYADHWRTIVGKSDADVAGMVRADGIDIQVCLAGRFDANRPLVCVHRAAPVQVSFHDGATSGFEDMDYWLTDNFLHPADTKELFTEELLRLPVLYQFTPFEDAPAVKTLPADHAGFITFGSFNNPAKINEDVIRLWAEVLKSVPDSRLRLKYRSLYGQATLQDRLLEGFEASGIAQDRILFTAFRDTFKQHLGLYGEVDIALDPFPFNGSMTTFQALWMGVPVISLVGETFISRTAGSILHHAGLGEFAVNTPEAYVACARDLAEDIDRLRVLRANLRERMAASPLCDAPAYARSVETAYWDIWRKWCAQQKSIL